MKNDKLLTFTLVFPSTPWEGGIRRPSCRPGGGHTKSNKGVPQIILVDEAIPVLVHDGEGLWKGEVGWSAQEKLSGGTQEIGLWTGENEILGFREHEGHEIESQKSARQFLKTLGIELP